MQGGFAKLGRLKTVLKFVSSLQRWVTQVFQDGGGSEEPAFSSTCLKCCPIARLSDGAQPELIQLSASWQVSASFLLRFFGRGRSTGAGGRGKLPPSCSYPDIAWEHSHISQLWISLGTASHSGHIPSSSPSLLPEANPLSSRLCGLPQV